MLDSLENEFMVLKKTFLGYKKKFERSPSCFLYKSLTLPIRRGKNSDLANQQID